MHCDCMYTILAIHLAKMPFICYKSSGDTVVLRRSIIVLADLLPH